jgi:hypothetical protein
VQLAVPSGLDRKGDYAQLSILTHTLSLSAESPHQRSWKVIGSNTDGLLELNLLLSAIPFNSSLFFTHEDNAVGMPPRTRPIEKFAQAVAQCSGEV